MNIDVTKQIKVMLVKEGLSQADLANRLKTSQGNLANKLRRNNFSVKEMLEIAEALGYNLKIEFKKK